MPKEVTILFGAPGTGKTTYLVNVMTEAVRSGIPPDRIAYMSFSRKAAREALSRALAGPLSDYSVEDFPWVRTLHSAAYRVADLRREDVMTTANFRELGDAIGMVFMGTYDILTEQVPIELTALGDRCLALYSRAKARGWSLEDEWRKQNDWNLPLSTLIRFANSLQDYKRQRSVVDFTDMIDMVNCPLPVDLIILDEAQDMTPQQWQVARLFGRDASKVFIAGDDDQRIYGFSGATASPLLTLSGTRIVLPHSYRLPSTIKALVDSITSRIKTRALKTFTNRDSKGHISWLREMEDVDLSDKSKGTWLLLARNRGSIKKLESLARRQNVVYNSNHKWSNTEVVIRAVVEFEKIRKGEFISYEALKRIQRFLPALVIPDTAQSHPISWEDVIWPWGIGLQRRPSWLDALEMSIDDREYIRGLRRRDESLTLPGRVTISTVHGAKGGEADNVLLLTDINQRVMTSALINPDDELRVLHVGVSRARETLYLVQPQTKRFWSI